MFVKGTPEFVKPKEEKKSEHDSKGHLDPWPDGEWWDLVLTLYQTAKF